MYVHFSVPPGATTQVAQSIIQECLESLPEADCASIMKQYKVTMVTLTVHVQEVRSTTLVCSNNFHIAMATRSLMLPGSLLIG